jgi:hypothetical protein
MKNGSFGVPTVTDEIVKLLAPAALTLAADASSPRPVLCAKRRRNARPHARLRDPRAASRRAPQPDPL